MAAGEHWGTALAGRSQSYLVAPTPTRAFPLKIFAKKNRRSTELLELDRSPITIQNREEQIVATREKSQWIVAQRLLSHLQYPDSTKSSAKDLSFPRVNL